MALRTLPFRQYNEHNVVNLYALDTSVSIEDDLKTNGDNDAGVLVSVKNGDFDKGIEFDFSNTAGTNGAYLGETGYPHVAKNGYPQVTGMTIEPTAAGATLAPLGFTLRQTATHDENGEKLLYYRQKAIEHQAVLPGEVVPVLTAGLLTLASTAFHTPADIKEANIGKSINVSASTAGKLDIAGAGLAVGKLLAVGSRTAGNTPDQFAGAAGQSAAYALIKIEL